MRLAAGARAALTLGPQMPLSKLTQAAMRMRQLAKGQSLALVATGEVQRLVWQACGLAEGVAVEAKHVAQWACKNTLDLIEQVWLCVSMYLDAHAKHFDSNSMSSMSSMAYELSGCSYAMLSR